MRQPGLTNNHGRNTMKTNYSAIRAAVKRLDEARDDLRKIANLRMGMISGMPSIADENAEFRAALADLNRLVSAALANNCRRATILEVLDGEHITTELVNDHFEQRENERDWERENARL